MRISDWSSDVCSSDLLVPPRHFDQNVFGIRCDHSQVQPPVKRRDQQCAVKIFECHAIVSGSAWLSRNSRIALLKTSLSSPTTMCPAPETSVNCRSEEHTSELQSLMRISYAVFCLKKKKNNHNTQVPTVQYIANTSIATAKEQTHT